MTWTPIQPWLKFVFSGCLEYDDRLWIHEKVDHPFIYTTIFYLWSNLPVLLRSWELVPNVSNDLAVNALQQLLTSWLALMRNYLRSHRKGYGLGRITLKVWPNHGKIIIEGAVSLCHLPGHLLSYLIRNVKRKKKHTSNLQNVDMIQNTTFKYVFTWCSTLFTGQVCNSFTWTSSVVTHVLAKVHVFVHGIT